jgi:hypothetical protein
MNALKSYLPNFKSGIFFQLNGKNILVTFCTCILIISSISCNDKNRLHPDPVDLAWNFNSDSEGWSGDFADYPVGEEVSYELMFEHDTLPLPLDQNQRALKLSGNNINSDLFMYTKKMISNLDPNTVYYITFTVEFASDIPGLPGDKESPGELIHIATGATPVEPQKAALENNMYGMNIDKCNGSQNGEDMIVVGNFTNNTEQPVYALKSVENEQPFRCTTNERGELWIIIGIDSGYQGVTTAYLNSVKVDLF